tara:strand:+ start:263 stop:442 length:180 start_codon:yes stop_codon:yes gene_type:complete
MLYEKDRRNRRTNRKVGGPVKKKLVLLEGGGPPGREATQYLYIYNTPGTGTFIYKYPYM